MVRQTDRSGSGQRRFYRRDGGRHQHGEVLWPIPRGECCCIPAPHGHYKTTTVAAALRTSGLVATTLFDGATSGERYLTYVTNTLVPALKRGDTVILDNLSVHKVAGVRMAVKVAGARLLYLPAYTRTSTQSSKPPPN